jgi:hypothetical protein
MIPAQLVAQLSTALARWDGHGPTEDEHAARGQRAGPAAMAVLTWDAQQ